MSRGILSSVLIVENESGNVFIVENQSGRRTQQSSPDSQQQSKLFCRYCCTTFASKNEQWMHFCKYLQCQSQSNFTCRICGSELDKKLFDDHIGAHESALKAQQQQHQQVKSESTPACNVLMKRKGVRTKVKYTRKKQRFECDKCGKYLSSVRSLQFHINLHRGDSTYICATCGENFFTPNGIKGHSCEKKRKRPERDFRTNDMRYCRFCAQHFPSLDENKAHKCEFQHPDDPKQVICRCCGKIMARLAFNRHMESHSGVDWNCAVCGKKLATERALKTHMTTHSGNKPYPCAFCPESFINKVVLERHMRFHGQQQRLFQCEFCLKQLSTETSLRSHVQRLHKNTVQCELCKVEFPNRDYLRDHIGVAHEPSVCKVCGKTFALPRYLKMHEKLHYEEDCSKVSCSICSKQLTARNLKHHVYRHHVDRFDEWSAENPSY